MLRYLGLLVTVCALPACSSSSAAPPQATGDPGCGVGGRTLAASHQARVYARGRRVYGCASGGRAYRLGRTGPCVGSKTVAAVAVTGRVTAYALNSCGVDVSTTRVVVLRLSDGTVLSSQPALSDPTGPESIQSVTSIVVNRVGHAAWIARSQSILSHRLSVQVLQQHGPGVRMLDSGRAIVPGSLRLVGTTLSWRHGGAARSATLG